MSLLPYRRHRPLGRQRHSRSTRRALGTACCLVFTLLSTGASAQSIGGGLLSYAQPFILAVIGFGLIVGLVAAYFNPMMLKNVVYGLIIAVVIFAIIQHMNALLSAVQSG